MKVSELNYDLPEGLIAREGLADRSQSRLMVLNRAGEGVEHSRFDRLVEYFRAGDCLVLNDTRVIPARFEVRRATGGVIEGLFLRVSEGGAWLVMLKRAGRLKLGERVNMCRPDREAAGPVLRVVERLSEGQWLLGPEFEEAWLGVLEAWGCTPLPPYIHRPIYDARESVDRDRYQTVYANEPGSVAAPTAGLHFTPAVLDQVAGKGVSVAKLTLHVGVGTFKPVAVENLEDHVMHFESYQVDEGCAAMVNRAIEQGGRVVAVGTTAVRTLETVGGERRVRAGSGKTNLFITPGYEFKIIRGMVTNFHLPKSTLLALVCAMAGTERMLSAYREAVSEGYRFYSYGDAMLIL